MGSSLDELIAEAVNRDMFLFDQLGMDAAEVASPDAKSGKPCLL
jgi:hypothetical protein